MSLFKIRAVEKKDIAIVHSLIKGLAEAEKRPEDVTGTIEKLRYWIFDRKIAKAFIAEYDNEAIGYAIFYPVFASYAAVGKIHLEDIFIKKEFRGRGFGTKLLSYICKTALKDGFTGMEWSALDWNASAIAYYEKLGAEKDSGRFYFSFTEKNMNALAF